MKAAAILCLLSSAMPGPAQSRAELSLDTAQAEIWVGQKVPLVVELLAPGYFAGAPFFEVPHLPGSLILPPVGSPVVSSREIAGVTYTVQRHELAVIPAAAGRTELPPFAVRFSFKRRPLDRESIPQTAMTATLSFSVMQPPGTWPGETVITSTDLQVTEEWAPLPGNSAHLGDAFVRTLRWSASDVPGMVFPPLDAGKIAGFGIYPSVPSIAETGGRGHFSAARTDSVTYVVKADGELAIPALSFRWWDPGRKQLRQAEFPARRFAVPAAPAPAETFGEKAAHLLHRHAPAVLTAAATVAALATFILLTLPRWQRFCRLFRPRHLAHLNPR